MVVRAVLVDRELCTVLLLLLASFPPGGAQRPPSFRAATTEHTLLSTARSKQCRAGGNCDTGVCSSTGRCTCAVLMGGERAAGRCRAVTRGWCLPPLRQLKSARAALLFELAAVAEGSKSSSAAAWMSRLFASAPHSLSTQQMAHFSLHSANELALGMMGTQRGSHPPLPRDDLPSYIDFSSCAVVGSSNSLLASQHGSAIDAHTAVIRFNQAPTAGYESHVGSRTTLRIQNSFAAGEVEGASSEVCLIRLSSSKKKNKDGARLGQPSGDGSGHGCGSVVQLSPQFEAYRRMLWYNMAAAEGSKWSSGFMGIALAVNLCASVSLYGFDFGSGYYFPKEHRKKDNKGVAAGHPWALERNCTRALAQLPSVTLHGR